MDKLVSEVQVQGGIAYESHPHLHGVIVHGIRLRPYDLGLFDAKQERLLCDMCVGTFAEHHQVDGLFDHPLHAVADTRKEAEVQNLFPNLQRRSWPLLSTHAGVIDVNFLISVVASQQQRDYIFALPHDTRDFPCVREVLDYNEQKTWQALEINCVLFDAGLLCAAARSAQEVWYDTDPNFELVSMEHEGVRLRMRKNTDPEADIVYANQEPAKNDGETNSEDGDETPAFGFTVSFRYPEITRESLWFLARHYPYVTCTVVLATIGAMVSCLRWTITRTKQ